MAYPMTVAAMALSAFPWALSANHFADSLLLGLMRDELAIIATPASEGNLPAEIPPPGLLVRLHLPDALTDILATRRTRNLGTARQSSSFG
jgi:hypothetical protein